MDRCDARSGYPAHVRGIVDRAELTHVSPSAANYGSVLNRCPLGGKAEMLEAKRKF